jgi:hypothetical protein
MKGRNGEMRMVKRQKKLLPLRREEWKRAKCVTGVLVFDS